MTRRLWPPISFWRQREGVFCEPASAASVAGLLKYARAGFLEPLRNDPLRIVCVLTGHGLKDPNNAIQYSAKPISVPATVEAILEHVELEPREQTV
ncbi:MAG: hypothetical protein KatS3mg130_2011 [Candidatus Sumerlaea sp.]|nr:MAG: hypothetical protein KatS3mg130_2011 [Candidatus Sumerlaea sp.]